MSATRVLFVDDEPNVLEGVRRQLHRQFEVESATNPAQALRMVRDQGPFAVVVSDMRMPGMDGVRLLARVRQLAPDTVRLMLTGNAEVQTAIEAVNEGEIFRFLTKPTEPEVLTKAVAAGIRQHQLLTAERELMGKTVGATVSVLTDLLALVNPTAFGRAARVRRIACDLATDLNVEPAWEVEIAAMLSQLGCVTVPVQVLERLHEGADLTPGERAILARHPSVGRDLVAGIPRLEGVAEIIGAQDLALGDSAVPAGARVLKAALDYDLRVTAGHTPADAIARMMGQIDIYDPQVMEALQQRATGRQTHRGQNVRVADLETAMILGEELRTQGGLLLVAEGQAVTEALLVRLSNFCTAQDLERTVQVLVPYERSSAA